MSADDQSCTTCLDVTQTRRYCALGRCYCGHEVCPAFASFVPLGAIPLTDAPTTTPQGRSSWDDREGSTWIDQL